MQAPIDVEQIPVSAYVNFQVMFDLERLILEKPDSTVRDLLETTSKRIGASPPLWDFYRPMNPGALFSFLYATLVVPKEIVSVDYFAEFATDVSSFFELSKVFENDQPAKEAFASLDFFRLLRNSVSHANFLVIDDDRIRMWNSRNGEKNFEVETDVNRLTNFAIAVSNFCIKKRNARSEMSRSTWLREN